MKIPVFQLQPVDSEGPVFNAPWEAAAFGMTVALHQAGTFTWREWAAQLSEEIQRAQQQGDPDLGNTYYTHWLRALEALLLSKRVTDQVEVSKRIDKWRRAYLATPHGQPVELQNAGE